VRKLKIKANKYWLSLNFFYLKWLSTRHIWKEKIAERSCLHRLLHPKYCFCTV